MENIAPAFAAPGGPELIVLLLILLLPIGVSYWVYSDASGRNNEHAANWAITVFLTSLFGGVPALVVLGLYLEVRE